MADIDIVTLEVLNNYLFNIAEEMGVVLVKTSYSTNIKERRDSSAALLTVEGETLAQAENVPLHLGSMLGLVEAIRVAFPEEEIDDGDVFIANDPYTGGGTHLPDITVAAPFFQEGKLVAWVADIAHHAEVGGARGGPVADIYEEGLRISPLKLVRAGKVDQPLMDMILLNCRIGRERVGDIQAQLAALSTGRTRLTELCTKYGGGVLSEAARQLLAASESRMRRAISHVPNGTYKFTDWMDDDGIVDEPIPIRVRIEVRDEDMTLDFRESGDEVAGNINVPRTALLACVFYALKAALAPDLPPNGGHFRAVEVLTRPGSIVDPGPTQPVQSRSDTCQRVVDAIMGALAEAVPERITAAWNGCILGLQFSGINEKTGRYFVYPEVFGGGAGASTRGGGLDAVQAHMTNTSNLPIESLEDEYPLRVERTYLVREPKGGNGQYQGGRGICRQVRVLQDGVIFRAKGDRHKVRPYGLFGGEDGAPAGLLHNPDTPEEKRLDSKVYSTALKKGDVVRIWTAGGGGYGNAKKG